MVVWTSRALTAAALAAATAVLPTTVGDARAADPGRAIAEKHCAQCHALGKRGRSPLPEAPPFRNLHERYPVESLAEALAEGIVVGHPQMPRIVLEPGEIDAFIAYLKSLE
jgi:mono/diheme cytochrome c family protein